MAGSGVHGSGTDRRRERESTPPPSVSLSPAVIAPSVSPAPRPVVSSSRRGDALVAGASNGPTPAPRLSALAAAPRQPTSSVMPSVAVVANITASRNVNVTSPALQPSAGPAGPATARGRLSLIRDDSLAPAAAAPTATAAGGAATHGGGGGVVLSRAERNARRAQLAAQLATTVPARAVDAYAELASLRLTNGTGEAAVPRDLLRFAAVALSHARELTAARLLELE
jgi:hypothetical protein